MTEVVFVPVDARVVDAAWAGTPVAKGRFVRAVAGVAGVVRLLPRRLLETRLDVAS